MRRMVLVLLLALLPAPAAPAAHAGPAIVRHLRVISDTPLRNTDLTRVLGLAEGKALNRRRLRQGIRALYAAGEVEGLEVLAEPAGPGRLDITVKLSFRPRISKLRLRGASLVWRSRILSWLHLHKGDPFSEAAVEASVRRVLRELEDRGYLDAVVEPNAVYNRQDNTVELTIVVHRNAVARISEVVVSGAGAVAEELVEASNLKPGSRLAITRLDRARDRVEAKLRKLGYWEGEVVAIEKHRQANGFRVTIVTQTGPRYALELHTAPDDEATRSMVLKVLFKGPEPMPLHPAQLSLTTDWIRQRLQRRGYLMARVTATLDRDTEPRRFSLHVEPGPRSKVEEVQFKGAAPLPPHKLRKVVRIHKGKVGGFLRQKADEETLHSDRTALEELLRSKGYAEATVGAPEIVPIEDGKVRVEFPLKAGPFWMIRDLRLVGFPIDAAAEIESTRLPLHEGGAWDPSKVEPMRRVLESALRDSGYPEATVTAETTKEDHEVHLRFVATPGTQVTIGEITISGLTRTRPSVVRRTLSIAGFKVGSRYSLKTILTAQRKLYQLGIFRHVDIVPIPGQEGRAERAYVVRCDEGLQRSYSLGLGWDTENKAHISLGWSHLNLFGGAHAINIDTRLSSREQRYRVTFREAALPYIHVPGSLTFFRTFERYTSYRQRRRGLFIDIGFHQRRPFRVWGRYQYQLVRPEGPEDVISEIGRENQEARISSIMPVVEWDLRDDPFSPTHGMFASLSVQYAFPLFSADSRYIKGFGNFSVYAHALAGTFAGGLRLGLMRPVAAPASEFPNFQVPVSVRFFAGGSASHRAFGLDKLGIPGQTINENGNPTGGNALVLINLEYRRKIKGPVSAVLFSDGGNVWSEPSRIRLGDMRWGVGLGLRLDTPAGPIRLEYAHKINRRPGESAGQWWFAFGMPF